MVEHFVSSLAQLIDLCVTGWAVQCVLYVYVVTTCFVSHQPLAAKPGSKERMVGGLPHRTLTFSLQKAFVVLMQVPSSGFEDRLQ